MAPIAPLRRLLALTTLASLIAAPAADAARPKPPSKLWYKVRASYQWTQTVETVHTGPLGLVETVTMKGRFDLRTLKGDAPLVRRARNGDIRFGLLSPTSVNGRYQNVDRTSTTRWTPGVPNSTLNGCSTTSIVKSAHLSAHPLISGLVELRAGRFNRALSTSAQLLYTDDSGVVTCTAAPSCPRTLPGRSSVREETATTCTFRPEQDSTGPAPLEGLPTTTQPILDEMEAQHDFEVPTGFGGKKLDVDSTGTGSYERTLTEYGVETGKSKETVVETIKLALTRCPGAGRKPC